MANWSADVSFSPDDLDNASALVTIDMTSVMLADSTLQAQAGRRDGFDAANHPTATYEASAFTRDDNGSFTADGKLTLRGISVSVPLAFTFDESDGVANVQGQTEISRLDFGVGAVGAADEAWLLYAIDVEFNLIASRAYQETLPQ